VVPASDLPCHQREARSYDLLWGLTRPVDMIVLTRAEFNRASRVLPAGYLSRIEERRDEPARPQREFLKQSQNYATSNESCVFAPIVVSCRSTKPVSAFFFRASWWEVKAGISNR